MTKRWLITGVSSGFGLELAKAALARGDLVAGTVRKAEQVAAFEALAPGRVCCVVLDVTEAMAIKPAVEAAIEKLGGITVLVNNAGYGQFGAVEELTDSEIRDCVEVNFFGTMNVVRAALPSMRKTGGHILNISSYAGMCGIPGVGIYNAAKFAVEGLSEALAQELAPFNIRVTIVEPGGFRTKFAQGSQRFAANPMPEYAETPAGQIPKMMGQYAGYEPGDPVKAMNSLLQIVDAPAPPLRYVLGADAIKMVTGKLEQVNVDIEAWRGLSEATAF